MPWSSGCDACYYILAILAVLWLIRFILIRVFWGPVMNTLKAKGFPTERTTPINHILESCYFCNNYEPLRPGLISDVALAVDKTEKEVEQWWREKEFSDRTPPPVYLADWVLGLASHLVALVYLNLAQDESKLLFYSCFLIASALLTGITLVTRCSSVPRIPYTASFHSFVLDAWLFVALDVGNMHVFLAGLIYFLPRIFDNFHKFTTFSLESLNPVKQEDKNAKQPSYPIWMPFLLLMRISAILYMLYETTILSSHLSATDNTFRWFVVLGALLVYLDSQMMKITSVLY